MNREWDVNKCALGVILLSASLPVQATGQPSFSGTWVLDPKASVLVDGGMQELELVIAEDHKTIRVSQRFRGTEARYSCTMDGKSTDQVTSGGSVYARSVQRETRTLVWQIKMTRGADKASIAYSERWSLSDEGRILTIHRVYPRGREVLQVFNRKHEGVRDTPRD